MSFSLPAFNLSATLVCTTLGGTFQEITLNLLNCNPNVLVTKTFFEMKQLWHEIVTNNVAISTISPSSITVKLIGAEKSDVEVAELMEGYVKHSTKSPMEFVLEPERNFCGNLKFSIFCGCEAIFRNEFGIQLNDKPPIPISFYAQNSMPMATLLDIDRSSLYNIQKSFEYDCMRVMFIKIVDRIRVHDEEINVDEMLKAKAKLIAETTSNDVTTASAKLKRRMSMRRDKKKSVVKSDGFDNLSGGDSGMGMAKEFGLFYGELSFY